MPYIEEEDPIETRIINIGPTEARLVSLRRCWWKTLDILMEEYKCDPSYIIFSACEEAPEEEFNDWVYGDIRDMWHAFVMRRDGLANDNFFDPWNWESSRHYVVE